MEIAPELAKECMNNYAQIMEQGSLKPIQSSYTASITYSTRSFAEWLEENKYLETSSELQVALGVYTQDVADKIGKPQYAGRLTTFIWPIVDGEYMPPFDGGEVNP